MNHHFDGIDTFVQVAESGSFAKAAENLFISRSAVGKSIARLEKRLGTLLFIRTTRSLQLTREGEIFLEYSLKALRELETACSRLDSTKQDISGKLRVSLPVLFGQRCVAPLLTLLARNNPELSLELSFSDGVVDLVERGYDFAVRGGTLADSTVLVSRQICIQHMQLCASPVYLERFGVPEDINDLKKHQCIVYHTAGHPAEWQFKCEDKNLNVQPHGRIFMNDLAAIAESVEQGDGIGWLPAWLIRSSLSNQRLVPVLSAIDSVHYPVHAVWPKTQWLPQKVRAAIDLLQKSLPELV